MVDPEFMELVTEEVTRAAEAANRRLKIDELRAEADKLGSKYLSLSKNPTRTRDELSKISARLKAIDDEIAQLEA